MMLLCIYYLPSIIGSLMGSRNIKAKMDLRDNLAQPLQFTQLGTEAQAH